MLADEQRRVVIHREWILRSPAHFTDVASTIEVASACREREPERAEDIEVTAADDTLIIGYSFTVDEPEAERRSRVMAATIQRVRMLAEAWSGGASTDWRQAAKALHDVLDGGEPAPEDSARAEMGGGFGV